MKNGAIIESREDGRFDLNIDCAVDAGIARIIRDLLETQNTRVGLEKQIEIRFKWTNTKLQKSTEPNLS
jgi:hypothetical protein